MRVVMFYSYKGGTGRTMALANVAACLRRLGRNVVVLDLDVDAPGAADKFGLRDKVNRSVKRNGGIVDFLTSFYDLGRSGGLGRSSTSIDEIAVEVAARGNGCGSIHMLPTINIFRRSYLDYSATYRWQFLVGRDDEEGRNFGYWMELKSLIEESREMMPDYLLVDLTSGVTPLGTATMIAWANLVVNFMGTNDDDLWATSKLAGDGLKEIIEETRSRLGRAGYAGGFPTGFEYLPVLSRIGGLWSDEDLQALNKRIKGQYFASSAWQAPLCVHSDPVIERRFALRIPVNPDGTPENVPLTREYLDLVARACPDAFPEGLNSVPQCREFLFRRLNMERKEVGRHRFFQMNDGQGVMVNMADGKRNVAFKVDTFTAMLGEIHRDMMHEMTSEEENEGLEAQIRETVERSFRESGMRAGGAFGKSLTEGVWTGKHLSEEACILEWCKFDSEVGFGKMTSQDLNVVRGEVRNGEIRIVENFLAAGRRAGDADLCKLMEGYLNGVLDEILLRRCHVTETHCMAMGGGGSCVFHFSATSMTSDDVRGGAGE